MKLRHIAGLSALVLASFAMASPMTTVLHRAAPVVVDADQSRAIVAGFSVCDPAKALPRAVFAPQGVAYASADEVAAILFSGNGLKDRAGLLLKGAVRSADSRGRAVVWSAFEPLRRPARLAEGVEVSAVGQGVSFERGRRPVVSVTFRFKRPLQEVLPKLERLAGRSLRGALDFSRIDQKAVGFEFDSMAGLVSAYALTCLRIPE